jgi:Flp pilus assembly protein TadD
MCPITLELMEDPVVAPSGHSFERASIEEHLELSPTNPMTGEPLSRDQLIPNRNLRDSAQHFKAAHADWRTQLAAAKLQLATVQRDREHSRQQLLFARNRQLYVPSRPARDTRSAQAGASAVADLVRRQFGDSPALAPHLEAINIGYAARVLGDGATMLLQFQRISDQADFSLLTLGERSFLETMLGNAHHLIGKSSLGVEQQLDCEARAVRRFAEAATLDPTNAEAWRAWAWSLDRLSQLRETDDRDELINDALVKIERALQIDPSNGAAFEIKGRILRAARRDDEAREAFEMSASLVPQNARALIALAELFKIKDDFESADCYFDLAVAADPHDAIAWYKRGKCRQDRASAQRKLKSRVWTALIRHAIGDYDRAIEINGANVKFHADRGYCLWLLGACCEARSAWRRGQAVSPNDQLIARNLATYRCQCSHQSQ